MVLGQGHWILGFGAGGFVGAFACHCRVLVCGGSWALGAGLSSPKFDIFLIIPNLLRFYVLILAYIKTSSVILLVAIWTCTKLVQSSKIFRPGL